MAMVVRAFPLVARKEQLREFVASLLGARQAEADSFYHAYGVAHESWHLQETPGGPWVIVCTELAEVPVASARYAASSHSFDTWFKAQVRALTGIDLDQQPLGPPTESVFEWSR